MDDEQRAATVPVIMQMEYGPPQADSTTESSFYADVGGLSGWERASVQVGGEPVEEVVRVREPEH